MAETTIKGLGRIFSKMKRDMQKEQRGMMRDLARITKSRAVSKFGVYQPQAGPFPAWKPLTATTRHIREAAGFTPNDPLVRTGALKASVGAMHGDTWAETGSNDDVMYIMEAGDNTTPPRPVFGPTLVESETEIRALIARHTAVVVDQHGVVVKASSMSSGSGTEELSDA